MNAYRIKKRGEKKKWEELMMAFHDRSSECNISVQYIINFLRRIQYFNSIYHKFPSAQKHVNQKKKSGMTEGARGGGHAGGTLLVSKHRDLLARKTAQVRKIRFFFFCTVYMHTARMCVHSTCVRAHVLRTYVGIHMCKCTNLCTCVGRYMCKCAHRAHTHT